MLCIDFVIINFEIIKNVPDPSGTSVVYSLTVYVLANTHVTTTLRDDIKQYQSKTFSFPKVFWSRLGGKKVLHTK
jgi:predicted membrane-bound spermidine synthase